MSGNTDIGTDVTGRRYPYSYAIMNTVPHPYTGEGVAVGVVLQSRPAEFIGLEVVKSVERLRSLAPDVDVEMLSRYLQVCADIAAGDEAAGEIALLSAPERFHWLTAPRSDVIQPSAVVHGVTDDPAATLRALFTQHVRSRDP